MTDGPKKQPNYELSGLLALEAHTVNGKVIKWVPPDDVVPTAEFTSSKVLNWTLIVLKENKPVPAKEGGTIPLNKTNAMLIGRDKEVADLIVEHPSLSSQHAVICFKKVLVEGKYVGEDDTVLWRPFIVDLGSTNGTFYNGRKLEKGKYVELMKGDEIRLGHSSRVYIVVHS